MKKIPFLKCNNTEIYLDNNYQMNEDLYYIEFRNKILDKVGLIIIIIILF